MGWFSRKDSGTKRPASKPRPSVSSEAQAAELRGRARRRLAGAVILVLIAVVVLPMVLDSKQSSVPDNIPLNIPDRNNTNVPAVNAPTAAPGTTTPAAPAAANSNPPAATGGQAPATGAPANLPPPAAAPASPDANQSLPAGPITPPADDAQANEPEAPPPERVTPVRPTPAPAPKPAPKPARPQASDNQRTDDGARALALLEGRSPSAAPANTAPARAASGHFILQVAAYSSRDDASAQRDKLVGSGVRAYIEAVDIHGKQSYRLRIGPFPTREAAQAAQARVRVLGFDNGFITAQ